MRLNEVELQVVNEFKYLGSTVCEEAGVMGVWRVYGDSSIPRLEYRNAW